MKKIYNAPLTEVVKLKAEQMICASTNITLSTTKYDGTSDIQSKDDYYEDDEGLW